VKRGRDLTGVASPVSAWELHGSGRIRFGVGCHVERLPLITATTARRDSGSGAKAEGGDDHAHPTKDPPGHA